MRNENEKGSPFAELFEVYEEAEYVHLVMEFCKGGSLSQLIEVPDDDSCASWEESNPELLSERYFKKIIRQLLFAVK